MNIGYLFLQYMQGQAKFRALITIFAVMVATVMLGAILALGQAWVSSIYKDNLLSAYFPQDTSLSIERNPSDAVYTLSNNTDFDSKSIKELGIHREDPKADLPAGLTYEPKENELLVTPGLKKLIDENALLQQRYKDYVIKADFPQELASSPDKLLLLYRIPDTVLNNPTAQVYGFSIGDFKNTYQENTFANESQAKLVRLVLLLIGIILVFPILILVVEASRIGIAQRERRYAALSLIGATYRQMRAIVLMETLVLGLVGVLCGVLVYIPIRLWVLSNISLGADHFWLNDIAVPSGFFLLICVVIVCCAVATNMQIFRGIKVSPLGVSRTKNIIKRPSFLRLLPLLSSCGATYLLFEFGVKWYSDNTDSGSILLALLLLTALTGLFVGGPYLTYLASTVSIKLSRSASNVIAAYRLHAFSQRIFHSVSGVVVALFVGTLLMTFAQTLQVAFSDSIRSSNDAVLSFEDKLQLQRQVTIALSQEDAQAQSSFFVNELKQDKDIANLTTKSYVQSGFIEDIGLNGDSADGRIAGDYYESCLQLEQRTDMRCTTQLKERGGPIVAGFQLVAGDSAGELQPGISLTGVSKVAGKVYDKAYILVAKDDAAFRQLRILVQNLVASHQRRTGAPLSVDYQVGSGLEAEVLGYSDSVKHGIGLIMSLTMVITGFSLLVSITGGFFDRKNAFIGLRMMGADFGVLRRSLLVESATSLLPVALLAIGLGILFCHWSLSIVGFYESGRHLSLPDVTFWMYLAVSVIICLVVTLLSTPLLAKITDPSRTHSE